MAFSIILIIITIIIYTYFPGLFLLFFYVIAVVLFISDGVAFDVNIQFSIMNLISQESEWKFENI